MAVDSAHLIPPEIPTIHFKYETLPAGQPSIRLLTLLPGSNFLDALKCFLTTHIWNPATGFVGHASKRSIEDLQHLYEYPTLVQASVKARKSTATQTA